jgi:hypothetical protein
VLLVLALVLLLGGAVLWLLLSRHNPFFERSGDFRAAQAIQSAVRKRALTEEEVAACMRLCESRDGPTQQSAIASLEAAVGRSPEFRPQALEALRRVAASSDPQANASATAALKRLESSPGR